jgi:hypothetical protein
MGSKPKKQGPTEQEKALAGDSAHKWNDYVNRYIPLENEFVNKTKATDDKVASARNMVNADAGMAHGQAQQAANAGLSSQGAAPGSGRAAMGNAALGDARGAAGGLGQAQAAQGVHDREQGARVKMSAFGRDLQDSTSLSLANSGRRATSTMLDKYQQKLDHRQSMISTGLSAAGAGVGAMNKGGAGSSGFNLSGQDGVRAFSQQDRMLRQQTGGLGGFGGLR